MNRYTLAVTLVISSFVANSALADDPPRCSVNSGATTLPPSGKVYVQIISMNTNGDMEPDPPLYDNRSDIYGEVTINADGTPQTFDLPELGDTDDPTWTYGNYFVSRAAPVGQLVHVVIHLAENDWGLSGNNDSVDVSPNPTRNDLEFDFDTCSLRVSGDISGSASGPIHVPSSGTGEHQGVLTFQIGMADGRALSTRGDVVLQGFDLVQVLPGVTRMIAQKPAVGLVTVANNTPAPQPVQVRLRVRDEANTLIHDSTESLGDPLGVGEVRSVWLAKGSPVIPTDFSCKPSRLFAQADLILQDGAEDPVGQTTDPSGHAPCWVLNNTSGVRQWDVATTAGPSLLWIRTGHILTATSLASMTQLHAIRDGAMPFIRGVFPARSIDDTVSSIPLVPVLSGGIYSFIASLLVGLGIPADFATPYAMVAELNAAAALSGHDRLMGALPKDWFNGTLYQLMEGMSGLSLGELLPRAVLFESVTTDSGGSIVGPKLTVPAHELGHTYGLSLDPSIKSVWCQLTPTNILGVIACGSAGGFDEYKSEVHPAGVPTWGYWVPQDPQTTTGREGEQCKASCLMGNSPINPYDNWGSNPKLIDPMDYDRVIDKLTTCNRTGASTALYVSGAIGPDDTMEFGWTFVQPGAVRTVDLAEKPGEWETVYALTLLDSAGRVLTESELPLHWSQTETDVPLRATLFGGYVAFPSGTKKIQIWNRDSGKLLGERVVSSHAPSLSMPSLKVSGSGAGRILDIAWRASDSDKDKLFHFVQVSPDRGVHWWPVAHGLTAPSFSASLADVQKGSYVVRVLTSDGVNVSSAEATVSL